MELNRSREDYLKTILMLERKKGVVRSSEVAKHLKVTRASVSYAVRYLKEDGFLTMDEHKTLHFTDRGREAAKQVFERHRVIMEGLIYLGVEPETAEQDACRIEHDISGKTFDKLKELLGELIRTDNEEEGGRI